jgi:phosphoglycolate phosphatase
MRLAMSADPLDLVLFDLDGTLVDSLPDIAAALNHGLEAHGFPVLTTETVATLVGDGIVSLANRALALQPDNKGVTAEALSQSVRQRYLEYPCVLTKAYDGITETLEALKTRGVPMAVLTNKPGSIARPLLDALGMTSWFFCIIGDGDGFPRKPDPSALIDLMARVNAKPERTVMVGDGVPDIEVAKAAGCIPVAALWGYSPRALLLSQSPHYAMMAPSQILYLP